MASSRQRGACCAGALCINQHQELCPQHQCLQCKMVVHVLCGTFISGSDDDDLLCKLCDDNAGAQEGRSIAEASAPEVQQRIEITDPEGPAGQSNESLTVEVGVVERVDEAVAVGAMHQEHPGHALGASRHDEAVAVGADAVGIEPSSPRPARRVTMHQAHPGHSLGASRRTEADADERSSLRVRVARVGLHGYGAASQTAGSPSSESNWSSACKRFLKYLEWMLIEDLPDEYAALLPEREARARRLFGRSAGALEKADIVWENIIHANIDNVDVDIFASWLFTHGYRLDVLHTDVLVQYKTADCDLSAVVSMLRTLAFNVPGERFARADLAKTRKGMRKMFDLRVMKENRPLVQPHKTSHESDLLRISMLCLMSNNQQMFALAFFVLGLCQFAGRATETAGAAFQRVTMMVPEEFKCRDVTLDMIPHFQIWRYKGFHQQKLSVFNNRDIFLLCFPFFMFVSMVTEPRPSGFLFPDFHKKAGARTVPTSEGSAVDEMNEEERAAAANTRNLGTYLRKCLGILRKMAETLDQIVQNREASQDAASAAAIPGEGNVQEELEEIAPGEIPAAPDFGIHSLFRRIMNVYGVHRYQFQDGLGCHSQKRFAVNELIQSPLISFVTQTFRCGWIVNALHTVFQYAEHSATGDRECARVLSRWTTPDVRGKYGGGHPPRLECLRGERGEGGGDLLSKVIALKEFLFLPYAAIAGANDDNLQLFLTASFLCRLGDFLDFLQNDPTNRFGTTAAENFASHLVLQRVVRCAGSANMGIQDLVECGRLVEKDFYKRNSIWVPEDDLQRVGVEGGGGGGGGGPTGDGGGGGVPTYQGSLHGQGGTIGTLMHSMDQRLQHLSVSNLDMKNQIQQIRSDLRDTVIHFNRQNSHISQQNSLIIRMLRQVLPQDGTGLGHGHESGVARVPLQLVAPTPVPAVITGDAEEAVNEAPASLPIPASIKGLVCLKVFNDWYLGYHRLQCTSPSVRTHVRFVVEYLNLFLDSHIQPAPDSVRGKLDWEKKLYATSNDVWEKALSFARNSGRGEVTEPLSSFKEYMQKCDHTTLPDGPSEGECLFQPDKGAKLRNKQGLITHVSKPSAQRRKRKRAVEEESLEEADSESDMGQS